MARTPRALAVPSSRGWRLSTASRTFRVLHRLDVILSLRRIRDPSARGDEVRILRLRSQARFAQDDNSTCVGPETYGTLYLRSSLSACPHPRTLAESLAWQTGAPARARRGCWRGSRP